MATGSTADFTLTRNDIIAAALRKCKAWPEDGNVATHKIREAVPALNLLLREEDKRQTGLSRSLWALDRVAVLLAAGRYIYGEDEGLSASIQQIETVILRDTSGGDVPIDFITADSYSALSPKNQTGDPQFVYLQKARLLEDQTLYIWPAPSSLADESDEVIQSEVTYQCILKHTAATENKPGSGASWRLFWKVKEVSIGSADTWAAATEYANGPLLYITFKRPLFDFDSPYDNPDMPLGWENYLIYRLAIRLAPDYDLALDKRNDLRGELEQIKMDLFPSERPHTSKMHNFARFF